MNKLDNIDTEFRFFKMEVLAGDPDFIVELVSMKSSIININPFNISSRASQTAGSSSISLRSIGTLGFIQSMSV